ncbi:MAG: hypothetical protein ACRCZY_00815 [Phocaeicola sp.]
MTEAQTYQCLLAAIMAEVESRHRIFESTEELHVNIQKMAHWLSDEKAKNGMYLCGSCGNGKTTFIKAFQHLVNRFEVHDTYHHNTFGMRIITAKEIIDLYKNNHNTWLNLANSPMLAIDDLGCEATEVLDFGNVSYPIIDLLSIRYEERLFTIITSNLDPPEIRTKYGDRIADRMNEMLERIAFENPTFRTDVYKSK